MQMADDFLRNVRYNGVMLDELTLGWWENQGFEKRRQR